MRPVSPQLLTAQSSPSLRARVAVTVQPWSDFGGTPFEYELLHNDYPIGLDEADNGYTASACALPNGKALRVWHGRGINKTQWIVVENPTDAADWSAGPVHEESANVYYNNIAQPCLVPTTTGASLYWTTSGNLRVSHYSEQTNTWANDFTVGSSHGNGYDWRYHIDGTNLFLLNETGLYEINLAANPVSITRSHQHHNDFAGYKPAGLTFKSPFIHCFMYNENYSNPHGPDHISLMVQIRYNRISNGFQENAYGHGGFGPARRIEDFGVGIGNWSTTDQVDNPQTTNITRAAYGPGPNGNIFWFLENVGNDINAIAHQSTEPGYISEPIPYPEWETAEGAGPHLVYNENHNASLIPTQIHSNHFLIGPKQIYKANIYQPEGDGDTYIPINYRYTQSIAGTSGSRPITNAEFLFQAQPRIHAGDLLIINRTVTNELDEGDTQPLALIALDVNKSAASTIVSASDPLNYLASVRLRRPTSYRVPTMRIYEMLTHLFNRGGIEVNVHDADQTIVAAGFDVHANQALITAAYLINTFTKHWHYIPDFEAAIPTLKIILGRFNDEQADYSYGGVNNHPIINVRSLETILSESISIAQGQWDSETSRGGDPPDPFTRAYSQAIDRSNHLPGKRPRPILHSDKTRLFNNVRINAAALNNAQQLQRDHVLTMIDANANIAIELYDLITVTDSDLGYTNELLQVNKIEETWNRARLYQRLFLNKPLDRPTLLISPRSIWSSLTTLHTRGVIWLDTLGAPQDADLGHHNGVRILGGTGGNNSDVPIASSAIDPAYTANNTPYLVRIDFRNDGRMEFRIGNSPTAQGSDAGGFTEYEEDIIGLAIRVIDTGAVFKWRFDILDDSDEDEPYYFSATSVAAAGTPNDATFRQQLADATGVQAILVRRNNANINWDDLTVLSYSAVPTAGSNPDRTFQQNTQFSFSLAAGTGGDGTITITVFGLPSGVTFDGLNTITGTAPDPTTRTITVRYTDDDGDYADDTFNLTITEPDETPTPGDTTDKTFRQNHIFSFEIDTATGGNAPVTTTVENLPAGATFDGINRINGQVSTAGTYPITIRFTDNDGDTAIDTFNLIIVTDLTPTAGDTTDKSFRANTPFSFQIIAGSGGDPPVTTTVNGLPTGVTFNGTDTIAGTATTHGTYTITITLTDEDGDQSHDTFDLVITEDLTPTAGDTTNKTYRANNLFSFTITPPSGGNPPLTTTVSGLPAGVTFNGTDTISGTATAHGTYTITIDITDDDGDTTQDIFNLVITEDLTPTAGDTTNKSFNTGQNFSFTITPSSGGDAPVTTTVAGLPNGAAFNGSDTISGTVNTAGTYTVTITFTDQDGDTAQDTFNIIIIADTSPTAGDTTDKTYDEDTDFNFSLTAGTGGNGALTITVTGLPAGATFDGANTISGNIATPGSHTITVRYTDDDGDYAEDTFNLVIEQDLMPTEGDTTNKSYTANQDFNFTLTAGSGGDGTLTLTVTGLPAGAAFDGTDTISGNVSTHGIYAITVRYTDEDGDYSEDSFNLVIVEDTSPTAGDTTDKTYDQDSDFNFTLTAGTGGNGNLTITVTGLPAGVTFNGADTISGNVTTPGTHAITVRYTDEDGDYAEDSFNLIISTVDTTPTAGDTTDKSYTANQNFSFNLTAGSGGNGALTISVSGLPAGATFDGTNTISGSVATPGAHAVTVRYTDEDGDYDEDSFTLTIQPVGESTILSQRFSTLVDLDAIFDRSTSQTANGGWTTDPGGSTTSTNTGPGTNSVGAYVYSESSGSSNIGTLQSNSRLTFKDTVMNQWAGANRTLEMRLAIQGDAWIDTGEGLELQGRASADDSWQRIALIPGWAYSNTYATGDTITDAEGNTHTCQQDGGWTDIEIDIPDDTTMLRLQSSPVAGAGQIYQHDISMWSLELRQDASQPDTSPTAGDTTDKTYLEDTDFSFSLTAGSGGDGTLTLTVTGLPSGATFDGANTISGNVTTPGSHIITVRYTDEDGDYSEDSFNLIIIADTSPTAGDTTDKTYDENADFSFSLTAGSGGNGNLTITVSGLPAGATFDGSQTISGNVTTTGSHIITVRYTDEDGDYAEDSFTLAIQPDNETTALSQRFTTITDLDAIFDRNATQGRGAWEADSGGTTATLETGPGTNSAGPYVYSETSGTDGLDTIQPNSRLTFKTTIMDQWTGTDRTLEMRLSIQGNAWLDTGEGFELQGRANAADSWQRIALIPGWAYSNTYATGDTITDAEGNTRTCQQDGGWIDIEIDIPDDTTMLRLQSSPVAGSGQVHQHDISLWSLELRETTIDTSPTAGDTTDKTYLEDTDFSFNLTAGTGGNGDLTVTVTGLPAGATFNGADTISGNVSTPGSHIITVRYTDEDGDYDEDSFNLIIEEDLTPTLAAVNDIETALGAPLDMILPAATNRNDPVTYTLTGRPTAMTFTPATRQLQWPAQTTPSSHTLTYTATDGDGDATTQTFTVRAILTLSNFNDASLNTDTLALIESAAPPGVFGRSPRPVSGALLNDAFTLYNNSGNPFTGNEPVNWLRFRDAGTNAGSQRISLNDDGSLNLNSFFAASGAGADLTLHIQTGIGTNDLISFPVAGNVAASGANYVIFNVPTLDQALIATISAGDRFIFALTRPDPTPTAGDTTDKSYTANQNFSFSLTAGSGGNGDLTISVTGLPTGATFNGTDNISGNVTTPGTHIITVRYTDEDGDYDEDSFNLTITADTSPTAGDTTDKTYDEDTDFNFALAAGAGGNGSLTITVTGLPTGATFDGANNISGNVAAPGSHTITVRYTDQDSDYAEDTFNLVISTVDTSPTAGDTTDKSYTANQNFSFNLTAGSGGNGSLTITISGLPAGATFDGANNISGNVAAPGSHTITVRYTDQDGDYAEDTFNLVISTVDTSPTAGDTTDKSYTANQNFSFNLTAGSGGNGALTITISGLPAGATFDNANTISGNVATHGSHIITARYTDEDGDYDEDSFNLVIIEDTSPTAGDTTDKTYLEDTNFNFTLTAGSGGNGSLTISVTGLPTGATFDGTSAISGNVTTPGSHIITVRYTDEDGDSAEDTFNLVIIEDTSPTAGDTTDKTYLEDTDFSFNLTAGSGGNGSLTISVTGLPTGATFDSTSAIAGNVATPGSHTITVRYTDEDGDYSEDTFTLVIIEDTSPTAGDTTDKTYDEDTDFSFSLAAGSGGNGALTISVSGLPAGATFDGATTIAGNVATHGSHTITVRYTDEDGDYAEDTFTLVIEQDLMPTAGDTTDKSYIGNEDFNFNLPAASGGDGTITITVTGLPAGATFDGANTISGNIAAPGSHTITVRYTDEDGDYSEDTFNLIIIEDTSPTAGDTTDKTYDEDTNFSFSLTAGSGGNGALTITVTGLPAGATFDGANTISGNVSTPGVHAITVRYTDEDGDYAEDSFTLTLELNPVPFHHSSISTSTPGVVWLDRIDPEPANENTQIRLVRGGTDQQSNVQIPSSYTIGSSAIYVNHWLLRYDGAMRIWTNTDPSLGSESNTSPELTDTAENNIGLYVYDGVEEHAWRLDLLVPGDSFEPYFFSADDVAAAGTDLTDDATREAIAARTGDFTLIWVDRSHANVNWSAKTFNSPT